MASNKKMSAQKNRRMTRTYKYSTLENIRKHCVEHPGSNAYDTNVFAVVTNLVQNEKKTRGSDYFCCFMIQDGTCSDSGLAKVRFFTQNVEALPHEITGNIVRIHRAKAQCFGEDLVLVLNKYGSLVHWPVERMSTFDDYKLKGVSSTETYNFIDEDFEQINKIKEWLKHHPIITKLVEHPIEFNILNTLQQNTYFNLVCQFLGKEKLTDGHIVIKVLDGTEITLPLTRTPQFACEFIDSCTNSERIYKNYVADLHIYGDHVEDFESYNFNIGAIIQFNTLIVWENPLTRSSANLLTRSKRKFGPKQPVIKVELAMLPGLNKTFGLADGPAHAQCKQKIETLLGKTLCPSPSSSVNSFHSCLSQPLLDNPSETHGDTENNSFISSDNDTITQSDNSQYNDSVVAQPDTMEVIKCSQPFTQSQNSHSLSESENSEETVINNDVKPSPERNSEISQTLTTNSTSQDNSSSNGISLSGQCQMESFTNLIDETLKAKHSTINRMINSRTEGIFKVFAQVKKLDESKEIINGIYHCCPGSGLRVLALNNGKPLKVTEECKVYIESWRNIGGYNRPLNNNDLRILPESGTQMYLPDSQGSVPSTLNTYTSENGDKWIENVQENYVYHKLTRGQERFHILYIRDTLAGKNTLKEMLKKKKTYNRVIRELSVHELTSDELPVVALQDGVFYYCSPCLAREPKVPTLEEEAHHFSLNKPKSAMGNPLMGLNFINEICIEDHTNSINILLQNKAAENFFSTTPEECFRDQDIMDQTKEILVQLENGDPGKVMDCMLKKTFQTAVGDTETTTAHYDLVNTKFNFTN